jgi:methionine aminopeptidase
MAEDDEEYDVKMEEGEYFAIETFGTTGSGRVRDEVSSVLSFSLSALFVHRSASDTGWRLTISDRVRF